MSRDVLILSTTSRNKLAEFQALLQNLPLCLRSLVDYPEIGPIPEEGDTFEANAVTKARAVAVATGLASLADDSGIVVDALGGEPGVRSARFVAGTDEDRNQAIVRLLDGVPESQRTCRYVAALALVLPDGREAVVRGTCEGRFGYTPRGAGGFGYDPYFLLPNGRTMAELTAGEKNAISHRGQAMRRMVAPLRALLGLSGEGG